MIFYLLLLLPTKILKVKFAVKMEIRANPLGVRKRLFWTNPKSEAIIEI